MKKTKERDPPEVNRIPSREDWLEYEREKARIQAKNLPPQEYDDEIRRLVDRLNL